MRILVKQEVYEDLTDIVKWYENQASELGIRFLNDWEKIISHIEVQPYSYQIKYKKFRHAKIKQFPYLIIYDVTKEEVVIYAVIHGHRNPRKRYLRRK